MSKFGYKLNNIVYKPKKGQREINVAMEEGFNFTYSLARGSFDESRMETIDIPTNVTRIRKECFEYNATLEEVVIPESVVRIGAFCFHDCPQLSRV